MIVSIDAGISGTGYAVWNNGILLKWGNIYPRSKNRKDWVASCLDILLQLDEEVGHVDTCYVEYPAYFASVMGEMVAKKGDLLKLTFLVGMIYSSYSESHLVPVNQWKGQLPKEVVNQRIRRILPETTWSKFKTHTWDAVGIGLYALNKLNRRTK